MIAIDPWKNYEALPKYDMEQVERTFDKFVGSRKNVEKRKVYHLKKNIAPIRNFKFRDLPSPKAWFNFGILAM